MNNGIKVRVFDMAHGLRKYEINKVCYYTNTDINMGYINKKIGKL